MLYAQGVMIHQKDLDNEKEKENNNNYNLHGTSTISKHWFDLEHDWLRESFSTLGPELYNFSYHMNITGQD